MKISINTGVENIDIERNGKIVGAVSFSLSDPALLDRLRNVQTKAKEIEAGNRLGQIEDIEEALDEAKRIDGEIRALLDWAFGYPVSEIVFGDSFSFTTDGGVTALEQFLEGVMPYIGERFAAETEAAKQRQAKYLEKYKR